MDCKKAESLVTDYINGKMEVKELEDFIAHVKVCSSCYDELQTYYTVYFAMEHLENGENPPSFNMNHVLVEDLKQQERFILLATCILLFLVILFLLIN